MATNTLLSGFSERERAILRDAAQHHRAGGVRTHRSIREAIRRGTLQAVEYVRNDSGALVSVDQVLQLGGLAFSPEAVAGVTQPEIWSGLRPEHHRSHLRTVITLEPIAADSVGLCVSAGYAVARVLVRSREHQFARPMPGRFDRLISAAVGPVRLIHIEPEPEDPDPVDRESLVEVLDGGIPIGSRIQGELLQPLAAGRYGTSGLRLASTALLRVYDLDPSGELTDAALNGYRYTISGITPGDRGAALLELAEDVRGRVVDYSPLRIVDSTGRDGRYTLAPSVTIDGTEYVREWDTSVTPPVMRLPVIESITEQLDDNDDPIVDGDVILPGAPRLRGYDPADTEYEQWYEHVANYSNQTASTGGWCEATWTGREWSVARVDC